MNDDSARQPLEDSLEELLLLSELYSDRMRQLAREEKEEKERPEKELVLWTAIAGIQFHVDLDSRAGRKLLRSLTPGTELVLRREPENAYDPWAVAVDTADGRMLGYITRFKNETLARMMDHGHHFEARVEHMSAEEIEKMKTLRTATEQFLLPFSVWFVR